MARPPTPSAAKEARKLTIGVQPVVAANQLIKHGWKYLGSGYYKIALAKDGVVVKLMDTHGKDYDNQGNPTAFVKGGNDGDCSCEVCQRRRGSNTNPSETELYKDVYDRLPTKIKKHLAKPFFVTKQTICQAQVDDKNCKCSSNQLDKICFLIRTKTGVSFSDISPSKNHGHLPDGTPVFYDGL